MRKNLSDPTFSELAVEAPVRSILREDFGGNYFITFFVILLVTPSDITPSADIPFFLPTIRDLFVARSGSREGDFSSLLYFSQLIFFFRELRGRICFLFSVSETPFGRAE